VGAARFQALVGQAEGEKGPHVKLIQLALMIADNADITDGEIKSSAYGPSTKAAVLAYKTGRSIINFSYQTNLSAPPTWSVTLPKASTAQRYPTASSAR
jgi:hypothetical protein